MSLVKKPTTGMKDITPKEMAIRDYVLEEIRKTYTKFGFCHIETPCVEHIENLSSKQGGENEKLIFKILKRGEKLDLTSQNEADLVDSGLRYDLTVPLARYYSNNEANLPKPFKALQMGNVWRADRPQKGRFRQFMQCDIDIIGEPTNLAEIELCMATTTLLSSLGFNGYKVRINDRRILKAMADYSGFNVENYDEIYIILDKMDKIGLDGVKEELIGAGYDEGAVKKYVGLFDSLSASDKPLDTLQGLVNEFDEGGIENLKEIFAGLSGVLSASAELVFDPTLVRGMSYYTGTIFEIEMNELNCSVAGGGRYDKMIGRFTGRDECACGFSIGFERIITIMLEKDMAVPGQIKKEAFLIEKGIEGERLGEIIKAAQEKRTNGNIVLLARMNKNKKFQKQQLMEDGYTDFTDFYKDPLKN